MHQLQYTAALIVITPVDINDTSLQPMSNLVRRTYEMITKARMTESLADAYTDTISIEYHLSVNHRYETTSV
jgi:hypothetical protein